jgi:mono/diheme cytochrome c family protein
MKLTFSGCVFTFMLLALAVPPAQASSRKQRERGAQLFDSSGCLHCHMMGQAGATRGPNLSGVGRRVKPAAMRNQILHGGKGMPAFDDVLKPKELDDLVAYLRSCRAKTPQ